VITKVAELIDPISGKWDEQLVTDMFCEEDAKSILTTPLREDMEDFPAWFPDPKGTFSVRSAYKLLARQRHSQAEGAESSGIQDRRSQECAPKQSSSCGG
jgi:hypothetical protein